MPRRAVPSAHGAPAHDLPDGYFHTITRGVAGSQIYLDDDDRRFFLSRLAFVVATFDWSMQALCLMSTHYHLVLEATRADLSAGMKRLNEVYALAFNHRHRRHGHLFSERFRASPIEDDEYLRAACEYVIWKPVRAGLCDHPATWAPWVESKFGLGR